MDDPRLKNILIQLQHFAEKEYDYRLSTYGKKDELDTIIANLNALGDKLLLSERRQKEKDKRNADTIEALLKSAISDFSEAAKAGKKHSDFDTIAKGLEALRDEIHLSRVELDKKSTRLLAANSELESFTYTVSHDLRAPLRAVHGYSQILLEDYAHKLDREGKRVLLNIMRNAKKMGQLIDNLLAYSRVGKQELKRISLNTNKLVRNIIHQLNEITPHKAKINILPLTDMMADYTLINLVFYNLISNAIKYSSKKKKPVIEIGESNVDGKVAYYISDNGSGFDMAYYDKLFGVFQRLHSDEEFEGTGVGLAIVQRIVLKHGGVVWAESAPGKGATFFFTVA